MMSAVATVISREKLLQIARALPADLHVMSKLGEILQDVNSELDEIAELVAAGKPDPARMKEIMLKHRLIPVPPAT